MSGIPRLYERLDAVDLSDSPDPIVLTIGTFDGVHLAHQALLDEAVSLAREQSGTAVCLTFRNHPRAIVAPERCPPLLTAWPVKQRLILDRGIDVIVGLEFNPQFASTSAEDFVRNVIGGIFRARTLISGPAFHFGRGGMGNADLLSEMGPEVGYRYIRREPMQWGGEKISSTRIRELIQRGELADANAMLGRSHQNSGIVVEGDHIGSTIGFPTANLEMDRSILVPADGVYAVAVRMGGGEPIPGMMNIGMRPTVNGKTHRKEVHLIGFAGDLRGKELGIEYISRLRGEQLFAGLDALKQQLALDRDNALTALREAGIET